MPEHPPWTAPWSWFVQAGQAGDARMAVVGATHGWRWRKPLAGGQLNGYWELSFGRWESEQGPEDGGGRASAWVTQLGVTPVLRWYPGAAERWFFEAGIGANWLVPVYRSREKRFSTTFNFGDHLGVGWRFGDSAGQEVSLRFQHFSNAGIRKPNPGENFVQLRYLARF